MKDDVDIRLIMDSENKVTVRDIARECGVSATTVSLALRNHPRISKKTKEKVQAAARRMNYTGNPLVSALMTRLGQARKPASPSTATRLPS